LLPLAGALALFSALVGCGMGPTNTATSGTVVFSGHVQGGQQPVTGAQIRLYAAGKAGNGSAATSKLSVAGSNGTLDYVTSDANGNFNFTGDFSCSSGTDQVYAVATGGNPGLANGTNNTSLVLMDAIGNCNRLASGSPGTVATGNFYIFINEVTTVGAAWALAPFMTSAANLGASSTNTVGIANAFLNAQLLADPSLGVTPGSSLPTTATLQTDKLNALADALASCVNSNGSVADPIVNGLPSPTPCYSLFTAATPSGGTAPGNTLSAALNIVKNPGQNVDAVFNTVSSNPPFATAYTGPPSDWTMSMSATGGGLFSPTQLAVDTQGNVWVANYFNSVSLLSPQGNPLSPAATPCGSSCPNYTGGFQPGLSEVYGLTVSTNDNAWATFEEAPGHNGTVGSVVSLSGVTSGSTLGSPITFTSTGSIYAYDNTLDYPESLAQDGQGNIVIGNYADGSADIYSSAGAPLLAGLNSSNQPVYSVGLASGYGAFPVAVASDANGGVWLANYGDSTVAHADGFGNMISHPNCCNGANGIATDKYGNAWAANYHTSSVSEISPDCDSLGSSTNANCGVSIPIQSNVVTLAADASGGIAYPAGVVIDAAQNVFIANYRGSSFSEIVGNVNGNGIGYSSNQPVGTGLSPSTGYGRDANMSLPFDIALDPSGDVWISDFGSGAVVVFFGLAAPTVSPAGPVPTAP